MKTSIFSDSQPTELPLGIIDVGSNSIKILLVQAEPQGMEVLLEAVEETRISAGIAGDPPRLCEASIQAGIDSIAALMNQGRQAGVKSWIAVATSAVRDATNQQHFLDILHRETGLALRVLSGLEEAHYIARGATCDPKVANLRDFRLVDLGGGSLEIISFLNEEIKQAISLPLGAVRLTEKFITQIENPLNLAELESISRHISQYLESNEVDLASPKLPLVASGGGFQVARQVWVNSPDSYRMSETQIPLTWLKQWRFTLASMSLAERLRIPGVPAGRADIMPAAVQIMVTLAEIASQDRFHITPFNLRYGIAREVIESL